MRFNRIISKIAVTSYFVFGLYGLAAQETIQTRISGQMKAGDDGPLAGVIMIEKGRLYGKDYKYGGEVDEDGRFSVEVPEGGDYALHLYATGYIYFPGGVEVKTAKDNHFNITLPPNAAVKDAPSISKVLFEPAPDNADQVVIKLWVEDPNDNLSHQVLGANIRTQEAFIFSPPKYVLPWKLDYPNGIYSITYNTGSQAFDPKEWIFVAADNRCYNSPVFEYPFTNEGVVRAKAPGKHESSPPPADVLGTKSLLELGRKTYEKNCSICHYADKTKTKVGPGLKGLFNMQLTPSRKIPVTEENIRNQILQGSERMPPHAHIKEKPLNALLEYLKTL